MTTVRVARTDALSDAELTAIRALLDAAFDGAFTDDDWSHTVGGWQVVVGDDPRRPLAHAALVGRTLTCDGHSLAVGYVEGVAARPGRQGEGLGTLAMEPIARLIEEHFDLGALSTGEHRFYERLGWERWRGPTFVRSGDELVRTPDEDDGIMVLRTEATRYLELTGPLACDARAGDDW